MVPLVILCHVADERQKTLLTSLNVLSSERMVRVVFFSQATAASLR
jgi:hypothetical protein